MLDEINASVLTYARVAAHGGTIIVSLNMSPRPQSITLDAPAAGLSGTHYRTLLSSPEPLIGAAASQPIPLPAFGAWVAAPERHRTPPPTVILSRSRGRPRCGFRPGSRCPPVRAPATC